MTSSSDPHPAVHPALPAACVVTPRSEAITRDKGDGTKVSYYLFDEYDIHANVLEPGSVQGWHHHNRIIETLYVVEGSMEAR